MHIALFIHTSHRLFADVKRLAERSARLTVFDQDGDHAGESDAAAAAPDLILNFITRRVFRNYTLSRPNVNFHPAPPNYPGIGGASRALYDGASTFGATAHGMVKKIDAGPIFDVQEVPIFDNDSSEILFARAEHACVALADRITSHLARHGELPPTSPYKWSGRYMSIREFHHEWLRMDPADVEEMHRKLRAATHSRHSGPYVIIGGKRFILAKDDLPG